MSSCHKCIELHDKRHREIVTIIQTIQRLDAGTNLESSPLRDKNRKNRRKNKDILDSQSCPINNDPDRDLDWDDSSSSTLVQEEPEDGKQLWNGEGRRSARDTRKAARYQTRFQLITKEELDNVQQTLHPKISEAAERADQVPNGQGLAENKIIDQNITFNTHTFKYSSLRQGIHDKKITKASEARFSNTKTPAEESAILEPMLVALGVQSHIPKASKERKNLIAKLRATIISDIEALENEQAETMKRMAGYWRYVNRHTYNQMVRNNEIWDWATGQKLPELEEEPELDTTGDGDESEFDLMSPSTPATTPMSSSPRICDDTDIDLPPGTPLLAGTYSEDRDWIDGKKDAITPTQATFPHYEMCTEDDADSSIRHPDLPKLTISTENIVQSPSLKAYKLETLDNSLPILSKDSCAHHYINHYAHPRLNTQVPKNAPPASPFDDKKDTRHGGHLAHPPSPIESRKTHHEAKTAFPNIGITIPPLTSNIYGHLDREIPAPCEDRKVKEPAALGRKCISIVIREKKPLEAEIGWEIKGMRGRARGRVFPAIGVEGVKGSGGGEKRKVRMGMEFAEVVRKGL